MAGNEKLLEIENLTVEYHTDGAVVHAVDQVSFQIKRGETLGLVGETGAGKTTIAKAILRILPDPPSKIPSGAIHFDGENILALSEKQVQQIRGNKISMIFQDPMSALNPIATVGDQIAETIKLHSKLSKAEVKKEAVRMLEMVGIPGERYGEYPHQFSGGMKQRVVIAMALACRPDLLLADEPTTALDVTIQAQILDLMRKLRDELSTSIIMITHDLGIIAEMCDNVAVVYAGEIIEYGSAEDIFDHTAHPYTVGLFNAIPRLNTKSRRLARINGLMADPTVIYKGCKFADRCPHADEKCHNCRPESVKISESHIVKCHKVQGGLK